MSRRPFTLILPYYENPDMLAVQFKHLAGLQEEVRSALHLIVVDDGSPTRPIDGLIKQGIAAQYFEDLGLASLQIFRIEVDVRWNWLAARNIGVEKAKTDWVLLTDIDHLVPEATARRIQEKKLDERKVYRFSRVDAPDLTPYKPHPNSWLLTRAMMDKVGGYDERFSGFYGTDGEFRDRVKANCQAIIMLDEALVRYPREVIADASTTNYGRKEQQDHEGVTRVRAQIAQEGGRPRRLSFPFHQVI
jgi:predicted glycosyltransferase involved in capsule biosynthesis